jgi:hypothetical protein
MKVYGYTNPENGYSASYSDKESRDIVVRGVPDIHLWEYDIPDAVAEPPGENTDPPIAYGSVIKAEISIIGMGGFATVALARVGNSSYPWVGLDPRTDKSCAWATHVIKSWKPLYSIPSADVLSQFLFQTQGHLMESEEADSLVAFIQQEMTK